MASKLFGSYSFVILALLFYDYFFIPSVCLSVETDRKFPLEVASQTELPSSSSQGSHEVKANLGQTRGNDLTYQFPEAEQAVEKGSIARSDDGNVDLLGQKRLSGSYDLTVETINPEDEEAIVDIDAESVRLEGQELLPSSTDDASARKSSEDLKSVSSKANVPPKGMTNTNKKGSGNCGSYHAGTQNKSTILDHLTQSKRLTSNTNKETLAANGTNNTTEPLWSCKKFNLTEQSVVILENKNSLVQWLDEINKTTSCAVVLFYAKWCYFSAKLAPLYNAAARAFSGIPFLALDVYTHHSLNTRYGIVGVPTIVLFQESRPVARFNRTRDYKDIVEFIHESTGLEYNASVEISPEDYLGPLPSTPSEEPNYYLIAAVLFLVCVGLAFMWRDIQMLWEYLQPWSGIRRILMDAEREKEE